MDESDSLSNLELSTRTSSVVSGSAAVSPVSTGHPLTTPSASHSSHTRTRLNNAHARPRNQPAITSSTPIHVDLRQPLSIRGDDVEQTVSNRIGGSLLRPVYMNAVEVGYAYNQSNDMDKRLPVRGVTIALWYFISRGHQTTALLPYCFKSYPDKSTAWSELMALYKMNLIEFTPGYGSDKYTEVNRILAIRADETGGCIVARSQMQNIIEEWPDLDRTIERRLLMPSFNGEDIIFPADGPLGRCGPNLQQTLECENSCTEFARCALYQLSQEDQRIWLEKLCAIATNNPLWSLMCSSIGTSSLVSPTLAHFLSPRHKQAIQQAPSESITLKPHPPETNPINNIGYSYTRGALRRAASEQMYYSNRRMNTPLNATTSPVFASTPGPSTSYHLQGQGRARIPSGPLPLGSVPMPLSLAAFPPLLPVHLPPHRSRHHAPARPRHHPHPSATQQRQHTNDVFFPEYMQFSDEEGERSLIRSPRVRRAEESRSNISRGHGQQSAESPTKRSSDMKTSTIPSNYLGNKNSIYRLTGNISNVGGATSPHPSSGDQRQTVRKAEKSSLPRTLVLIQPPILQDMPGRRRKLSVLSQQQRNEGLNGRQTNSRQFDAAACAEVVAALSRGGSGTSRSGESAQSSEASASRQDSESSVVSAASRDCEQNNYANGRKQSNGTTPLYLRFNSTYANNSGGQRSRPSPRRASSRPSTATGSVSSTTTPTAAENRNNGGSNNNNTPLTRFFNQSAHDNQQQSRQNQPQQQQQRRQRRHNHQQGQERVTRSRPQSNQQEQAGNGGQNQTHPPQHNHNNHHRRGGRPERTEREENNGFTSRQRDALLVQLLEMFGFSKASRVMSRYPRLCNVAVLTEHCLREPDEPGDDEDFRHLANSVTAGEGDMSERRETTQDSYEEHTAQQSSIVSAIGGSFVASELEASAILEVIEDELPHAQSTVQADLIDLFCDSILEPPPDDATSIDSIIAAEQSEHTEPIIPNSPLTLLD